jgi:Tol biopolymer transport system component
VPSISWRNLLTTTSGPRLCFFFSPDVKRLMYVKILGPSKMELWVSSIDGGHPLKLASSGRLTTLAWARNGSQLAFADNTTGQGKTFLVGADGRGLRPIEGIEGFVGWLTWSADEKTLYISSTTNEARSGSSRSGPF